MRAFNNKLIDFNDTFGSPLHVQWENKLGPVAKPSENHCFKMMHKEMTLVLHDKAWTCSKSNMHCTIQMLSNNNHFFDVGKSGGWGAHWHALVESVCANHVHITLVCVCVCVCRDHTNENLWDSCSPSWERKRVFYPLYSHSMTQTYSLINHYLIKAWF